MSEDLEQPKNEEEDFVAPETGEEGSRIDVMWEKGLSEHNQPLLKEALDEAEERGERILEVPVNISYSIKMPESAVLSFQDHSAKYDNIIYYQTGDVRDLIRKCIRESVNELDPDLAAASKQKYEALHELRNMYLWNSKKQQSEKTSSYDPEKAQELTKRIRGINEKFKCSDDDIDSIEKTFEKIRENTE